jgi:RHS repeat-associated protein
MGGSQFADLVATPSVSTGLCACNPRLRCSGCSYDGVWPLLIQSSAPDVFKFTGKERDSESNLDMFGARYYASTMGRFITPDWSSAPMAVPYAVPGNPQSLNLYGYTKNNPTTLTDPNGHCWGWAQTLCDAVQVGVNYLDGNGAKTNAELAHDTAAYNRNWYVNHAGGNKEQFDKMTDKQVNDFDRAYQNGDSSFTSDGVKFVIAAAANAAPMLGANGTQVTSKTLWNQGSGRIDVENPNPGQRPGQIHYQDGAGKYIYDVGKGEFQGLSATQNRELLSQPEVQQAIQKGLKYLGAAQ